MLDGNLELLKRSIDLATQTGTNLENVYWNLFYILDVISREVVPGEADKKLMKCNIAIDKCAETLIKNLRI